MRRPRSAAALLLIPVLAACEEEPLPEVVRPVRAMTVMSAEAFESHRFPGKARATLRTNISFEVSGRMIQRPVDVGDPVEKGQLLAALDLRDFENSLEQAKAVAKREQVLVERLRAAQKSGAVSLQEVNDAEARLDASEAEVRIREKNLEDATLYAPHDGKIAATYVERFEQIAEKQPIMRLLDTSRIEMIVNVPENLIHYSPFVKEIDVRFDSHPDKPVSAELHEVSNEATEATRTYPVTLIMDQPSDFEIQPGMSGNVVGRVVLPEDEGKALFEVPITAVYSPEASQDTFLWVIDEQTNTVSRRQVRLGGLTDFGVRVEEGLTDGEVIAIAGVHFMREGLEVKILEYSEDYAVLAPDAGRPSLPLEAGQQVKVPTGPEQPAGSVTSPFTGGKESGN